MNTASTSSVTPASPGPNATLRLNEGFLSRRNWLDWLFAVLVTVCGLFAFQRFSAYLVVYE